MSESEAPAVESTGDVGTQAVKFLIVGAFAAGAHYAIYVALVLLASAGEVPATGAGFVVGTVISYTFNSRFTFQAEQSAETFVRFWAVTLVGGLLNAVVVWLLVRIGVHFTISGVVAIVIAAAFNFTSHRLWTFRERHELP